MSLLRLPATSLRGLQTSCGPMRLPRGSSSAEATTRTALTEWKEQEDAGVSGRWKRYVRDSRVRRNVTQHGIESLEKQVLTSFGGIRLDKVRFVYTVDTTIQKGTKRVKNLRVKIHQYRCILYFMGFASQKG